MAYNHLVPERKPGLFVMPVESGIQDTSITLDSGTRPGLDPGFAEMTEDGVFV